MPRAQWQSYGEGKFLMSEVPLYGRAKGPSNQPSELEQIDDIRIRISWLTETNSPLPTKKWLQFQA